MAEGLFVFEKRGIEKIELERSMKHAIKNFKVCGLNHDEQSLLRRECETSIACICKSVCIKEVFADRTLDERKRRVNDIYLRLDFVKSNEETDRTDGPYNAQERTTGQRGIVQQKKKINKIYKEAFETLFNRHDYLMEKYGLNSNERLYEKIPALGIGRYLADPDIVLDLVRFQTKIDDGFRKEVSTDKFSMVIISEMTTRWAKELVRLSALPEDERQINESHLYADFKNAYIALAGRFAAEMIIGNNIFKKLDLWMGHIKVIIALSVYLSVLESVFHNIGRNRSRCGYKELADILQ